MAQFIALNPKARVNGQTVLSVVSGMSIASFSKGILADNGIIDPKPGEWYSQQAWLDAFRQIAEKIGPATLNAIGKQIPEKAEWPAEIDTIEKALGSIDIAYHMNHRIDGVILFDQHSGTMKEGIGHYKFEVLGDNKGKMICDNPYPCDFDMGIIEAVAEKFKPGDSRTVSVAHDESGKCRKNGDDNCAYIINW